MKVPGYLAWGDSSLDWRLDYSVLWAAGPPAYGFTVRAHQCLPPELYTGCMEQAQMQDDPVDLRIPFEAML